MRKWVRDHLTPGTLTAAAIGLAVAGCTLNVCGGPPVVVRIPRGELPEGVDASGRPACSLDDLGRFPCRKRSWDYYWFAKAHLDWIQRQALWSDSHLDIEAWANEQRFFLAAWSELADAWGAAGEKNPEKRVSGRLEHLRCLRRVIGAEAYGEGRMPPPCPWWRFRRR